MSLAFTWQASASRVIFHEGALGTVLAEVDRIGASRVLLIGGGAAVAGPSASLRAQLGALVVAWIDEAAQHVPAAQAVAAADRARGTGADVVVSLGGGSATGLGKAVAVACDLPLVAVPTTYAGSEMTPVWGRTEERRKMTARDDSALPACVVYDPSLYRGMPVQLAAASGMNALAHCLEALWLPATSPMTAALAELGVRQLLGGLPRVMADNDDVEAHGETLLGACLGGLAFAQAGTGIHHRACHVLGGSWNLPHAQTHAVMLPHSTALAAAHSEVARGRLSAALGDTDPALRVFTLLEQLELPRSLRAIGLPEGAVAEATARVMAASRDDPLAAETSVAAMLAAADAGRSPAGQAGI